MSKSFVLASGNITIGDHHGVVHVLGMTIYLDVVWTTLIAAGIVLGLGLLMRRNVTSGVPGKLQLFWETLVEQVSDLASSAIGPEGLPSSGWASPSSSSSSSATGSPSSRAASPASSPRRPGT